MHCLGIPHDHISLRTSCLFAILFKDLCPATTLQVRHFSTWKNAAKAQKKFGRLNVRVHPGVPWSSLWNSDTRWRTPIDKVVVFPHWSLRLICSSMLGIHEPHLWNNVTEIFFYQMDSARFSTPDSQHHLSVQTYLRAKGTGGQSHFQILGAFTHILIPIRTLQMIPTYSNWILCSSWFTPPSSIAVCLSFCSGDLVMRTTPPRNLNYMQVVPKTSSNSQQQSWFTNKS